MPAALYFRLFAQHKISFNEKPVGLRENKRENDICFIDACENMNYNIYTCSFYALTLLAKGDEQMDSAFTEALLRCETDLKGALNRLSGDEELYIRCLELFLEDQTMAELHHALETQAWDDAFTAAHALKGLAGNMGFIPLFHASAELVVLIRAGRTKELAASYLELDRCYHKIYDTIGHYCATPAAL